MVWPYYDVTWCLIIVPRSKILFYILPWSYDAFSSSFIQSKSLLELTISKKISNAADSWGPVIQNTIYFVYDWLIIIYVQIEIEWRITWTVAVLMYKWLHGTGPAILADKLSPSMKSEKFTRFRYATFYFSNITGLRLNFELLMTSRGNPESLVTSCVTSIRGNLESG
jgi:hypothetical protein